MDHLTSLFHNITIDSILDIRSKLQHHFGAYRRGDDIIILSDSIRTVRGSLKFTFLDGNPPSFNSFSLSSFHEDPEGKSYFMLDGNTPYPLSLIEAGYVHTLMDAESIPVEFMPSLFYSYDRVDFFILNVDATEKYLFHIPFIIQFIDNFEDLSFVIHYIPEDADEWCEPITDRQANVICRIYSIQLSELSPYKN